HNLRKIAHEIASLNSTASPMTAFDFGNRRHMRLAASIESNTNTGAPRMARTSGCGTKRRFLAAGRRNQRHQALQPHRLFRGGVASPAGLTRGSILLRKTFFFEVGWIAGSSPAMTDKASRALAERGHVVRRLRAATDRPGLAGC